MFTARSISSIAGIGSAAFLYLKRTDLPEKLRRAFGPLYTLLDNKYYFDRFNDWFFAGGARLLGCGLWKGRRRGGYRRLFRGRFGTGGGLVCPDCAQIAVGPDLPLRIHHDHRRVRAPHALVREKLT